VLMMSTNNILLPASGKPIINPTQDMVLGLYYATRAKKWGRGCFRQDSMAQRGYLRGVFANPKEVRVAYDAGEVELHSEIRVRLTELDENWTESKRFVSTTVGRVLVGELLPEGLGFDPVNKTLDKKALSFLIDDCYRQLRNKQTVLLADRLRTFGFEHATRAGVSIAMRDLVIPAQKQRLVDGAQRDVARILGDYHDGLLSESERRDQLVELWAGVADELGSAMTKELGREVVVDPETGEESSQPSFNPIYMMADSGARGATRHLRQLAAMRGLMAKGSGEILETPITANLREGLSALQYFISTHGARKGLADVALKTSNAGFLTRRLADVAQDVVITEYDCGTVDGMTVAKLEEGGRTILPLACRHRPDRVPLPADHRGTGDRRAVWARPAAFLRRSPLAG